MLAIQRNWKRENTYHKGEKELKNFMGVILYQSLQTFLNLFKFLNSLFFLIEFPAPQGLQISSTERTPQFSLPNFFLKTKTEV